jgi:hypothetical protein
MNPPLVSSLRRCTVPLIGLLLAASVSCDPLPPAARPARPLPTYAGHAAELFDDSIEPAAVGLSLEGRVDPHVDRGLRERTQVGDAVVRVRATTVTAKQEESGTRYVMGLRTLELVAGPFPPGNTFEVGVDQKSPSVGLLKGMENQIVGKTFIAFVRAFVRADGDTEVHFHLAPDTKEEVAAVKDAAALANL